MPMMMMMTPRTTCRLLVTLLYAAAVTSPSHALSPAATVYSTNISPPPAHSSSTTTTTTTTATTTATNNYRNCVELRQDPFGGTGLYATTAIRQGETMFHLPETKMVFGAPADTPISNCVSSFCHGKNGITESISIGASLASWRLLQQHHHHQYHQSQSPSVAVSLETLQQQAGISPASAGHAATLPWESARWQLPSLWPLEVLEQALDYGYQQVVRSLTHSQSLPASLVAHEIRQACDTAKDRVHNFQTPAIRLAQELGPSLQHHYGIRASDDDISLACHQAMALVFSRTFLHPPSGEMTMFPVIDSANHNAVPNAMPKNDYTTTNGGGSMLVAQTDICEGEEITISYGLEESGAVLSFSGYGFVPHGMAHQSPVGRALQLAALKGQEIAKELLQQHEQPQQQQQQQQQQGK